MKTLITAMLFAALTGTGAHAFATATGPARQDAVTDVQAPALPLQQEARRGRGADDAAGHTRRGRGRDDGPNHS